MRTLRRFATLRGSNRTGCAVLFGEVHVPELVMAELQADGAPEIVRRWAHRPPNWLKIHPNAVEPRQLAQLTAIDAGERAALALALELPASLVLADDRAAHRAAMELGFVIAGTESPFGL